MDALRKGRAYAVHGPRVQDIALESFTVEAGDGAAGMGEEMEVSAPPRLRFRTVCADTAGGDATEVRVIRGGFEVHKDRRVGKEIDWAFEDASLKPGDRAYYRLEVEYRTNRIVTNPIFVKHR
jgi:hypothetical protein